MVWRINRDESDLTSAEKAAWDIILPQMHIPIIEEDHKRVEELVPYLEKIKCPNCKRKVFPRTKRDK